MKEAVFSGSNWWRFLSAVVTAAVAANVLILVAVQSIEGKRVRDYQIRSFVSQGKQMARLAMERISRLHYRQAWQELSIEKRSSELSGFFVKDENGEWLVDSPEEREFFKDLSDGETIELQQAESGYSYAILDGYIVIEIPIAIASGQQSEFTFTFAFDSGSFKERMASHVFVGLTQMAMVVMSILLAFAFIYRFLRSRTRLLNEALLRMISTPESEVAAGYGGLAEIEVLSKLRESFLEARRREVAAGKLAAIAQMTQMLAHDVRKPLTMAKMAVDLLSGATTVDEIQSMRAGLILDVDRAIDNANGLITDVMEIGSHSPPTVEPTSLVSLIQAVVTDSLRLSPSTKVFFEYRLSHKYMARIDSRKVTRVFANIIGNAIQAVCDRETILIETSDKILNGEPLIEVRITNSGSRIAPEDLPNLFEAFFTKGKREGTGLGLAIAKKVVCSHGGEISCTSGETERFPNGFVRFEFTLPSGLESDSQSDDGLPCSVEEVVRSGEGVEIDGREICAGVAEIAITSLANMGTVRIAIVDDESVYRESVLAKLNALNKQVSRLGSTMEACLFVCGEGFVSHLDEGGGCDLLILDIDMGPGIDGFEVLKRVRPGNSVGLVCVHSNRITAADQKRALELGADAFIPKPLSTEHLERLLILATKDRAAKQSSSAGEKRIENASRILRIAVVDDALSVRLIWKAKASYADVTCFESPEKLFTHFEDSKERFDAVVTDYHFGVESNLTGLDLAIRLHETEPRLPVILSSSGEFTPETCEAFTAVVGKGPLSAEELASILRLETVTEHS
jgi:signal transduction histidine kinase/FixJ family two-component response regulator